MFRFASVFMHLQIQSFLLISSYLSYAISLQFVSYFYDLLFCFLFLGPCSILLCIMHSYCYYATVLC
jgi:hypothetical protein